MTAPLRTLVLVGENDALPWLRIAGDGVVTRGDRIAALPPVDPGTEAETIAVVPGDAVVIHWVELPVLAPAQTAAAARLLAADVSATPIDATHVAIGSIERDGWRMLALVDAAAMAQWLAQLAAAGIDPDRMLPAPLLLGKPETGVAVFDGGSAWTVRGARAAFAAEPDLARLLIGDEAVHPVDTGAWQAGLAAGLAAAPLDLRQGAFARARRWPVDRRRLVRIAGLAAALAGVLIATELASILRHGFAADRTELQLADAARQALPRGTLITDPRAQVAARLAQAGADGSGFSALAGPLVAAVRDRQAVMLQSLEFSPANGMVAILVTPTAADRDAIVAALDASGIEAAFGAPREERGQPLVELRLRRR